MGFPEGITHDGDRRRVFDVLLADQATDGGSHSERFEEIPPDIADRNCLRFQFVPTHNAEVEGRDDHFREDVIAVAHGLVGVPCKAVEAGLGLVGTVMEDFDEAPWIADRERVEHQAVHHREDGGVGADAEGKRQNGNRREAGGFTHHAEGIADILRNSGE